MNTYSPIIIAGAGAAGLTAAIFASSSGSEVLILERAPQAGRKILMSGGTRCNVLPVEFSLDDYFTDSSPKILRNIFKSWSVDGCYSWFSDDLGLEMACEKESNKWFPKSNSAQEVRDVLLQKALNQGVKISFKTSVTGLTHDGNFWQIKTDTDQQFHCDKLIIATGGLSIPSTGTDGTGHRVVRQVGHSLNGPYPALTPLKGHHPGTEPLPGVSLDVNAQIGTGKKTVYSNREGFVFTHQGYSGPSILDLSHHVVKILDQQAPKNDLLINWAGMSESEWQTALEGKATVRNTLKKYLPARLAEAICSEIGIGNDKSAELRKDARKQLMQKLTAYPLRFTGHEGYKKAEVTGGGVPLNEINHATMESKKLPNLFLCGEILDVFGRIGGFNFYWAWVSGRLAGLSAKS